MFRMNHFCLLVAGACLAQAQTLPAYRIIDFCEVQPGQAGNAAAAYKDYAEHLKKAGWDQDRQVYRSHSGPMTMAVVRYYKSHGDMPMGGGFPAKLKGEEGPLTAALVRLQSSCARYYREIERVIPEVVQRSPGALPKFYVTVRIEAKADKIDELKATLINDYGPAVKKGGTKAYVATQAEFGAPRTIFTVASSLESTGSLDDPPPVAKAMGTEGYQRYLNKVRPMITSAVYHVWEHMPELSYVAPK